MQRMGFSFEEKEKQNKGGLLSLKQGLAINKSRKCTSGACIEATSRRVVALNIGPKVKPSPIVVCANSHCPYTRAAVRGWDRPIRVASILQ